MICRNFAFWTRWLNDGTRHRLLIHQIRGEENSSIFFHRTNPSVQQQNFSFPSTSNLVEIRMANETKSSVWLRSKETDFARSSSLIFARKSSIEREANWLTRETIVDEVHFIHFSSEDQRRTSSKIGFFRRASINKNQSRTARFPVRISTRNK